MYVSMCCGNINMSPVQVNLLKRFVSDFKNKILIIVVIVLTHSIHWSVLLYSYRFVNYYFFIEYPLIKSPLVPAEVPVWDFCYPLDILMSWQIPPKLTIIDGYCERGRQAILAVFREFLRLEWYVYTLHRFHVQGKFSRGYWQWIDIFYLNTVYLEKHVFTQIVKSDWCLLWIIRITFPPNFVYFWASIIFRPFWTHFMAKT